MSSTMSSDVDPLDEAARIFSEAVWKDFTKENPEFRDSRSINEYVVRSIAKEEERKFLERTAGGNFDRNKRLR